MQGNFDHVFLIDHNPVGFSKLLLKYRVEVFEFIGMVVAENIFLHHSRLRYARTYNRGCCDKYFVIITFKTA
ncbi:hypothetical protein D3C87_2145630 [compost metagenome]